MSRLSKSEKSDWRLTCKLSQDCTFHKIKNSDTIRFLTKAENGKEWITGFVITIENTTFSKANLQGRKIAIRLLNLISANANKFLDAKVESLKPVKIQTNKIDRGNTENITNEIEINLDLTNPKLNSLLNRNSRFNQQIAHFRQALKSIKEDDPVTVIREFFLIFNEEKLPPRLRKYKSLRHVLSHYKITHENTKDELKKYFSNLDFDFRMSGIHFDITSPHNMTELRKMIQDIRIEAIKYIWKINF